MPAALFLDFDGVMHRGDAYLTPEGIVSSAPGQIELFEFAPLLVELLEPYPSLPIVLSTDWATRVGFKAAYGALPRKLGERVVGCTHDVHTGSLAEWAVMPRGCQVRAYVRRYRTTTWLAIDDRRDGFEGNYAHLVHCQADVGLGDDSVVELFRRRLREQFGAS